MPENWVNPPTGYVPAPNPDPNNQPTFQLELQDDDYTYDIVGNPITIYDNREPDEWPNHAKPVHRAATYDDLYRLSTIAYTYEDDDTWQSPFHEENAAASTDTRRSNNPSPHVSFNRRIASQDYTYDWLGNTTHTDDDARGFYDRSLGDVTNSSTKPYQLASASNESATPVSPEGNLATAYDAAGNLTRLHVRRHGTCLPSGADCNQIFAYDWDEVGRLVQARRWDVSAGNLGTPASSLPGTTPDVRLQYAYDAGDQRVIKTAIDSGAAARYTLYIFDTLELRRAEWVDVDPGPPQVFDYELTKWTEVPYLYANGTRLARVHYDDNSPEIDGEETHVLLELGDHLGSTSVVIERDTGELVERGTYQAYGGGESSYRPARWEHFREDYRFTGKEEDVEVGLQYFGARYYAPLLQRWVSPDPLEVQSVGATGDLNVYAYVSGEALRSTDPLGLCKTSGAGGTCSGSAGGAEGTSGTDAYGTAPKAPDKLLGFDPKDPASARAAGAAMGGIAAAMPGAGEYLLANAMNDLRGELDRHTYNAWLQGVVAGAEATAISALATAESAGGSGLVLAPTTGGSSAAVGGVVATGALAIAANAQVIVAMAVSEYGKGRVPAPDGGFTADLRKSNATTRSGHRNAANKQLHEAMKADPKLRRKQQKLHGKDVVKRTGPEGGRKNPRGTEWDHNNKNPNKLDLRTKENHRKKSRMAGDYSQGGGYSRFHKQKAKK